MNRYSFPRVVYKWGMANCQGKKYGEEGKNGSGADGARRTTALTIREIAVVFLRNK